MRHGRMSRVVHHARLVQICMIAALSGLLATAQEFRSTITGRVLDAQQAVVPGAKVACANVETG